MSGEREFERIYDEHADALYRFAYRLTGSEADAEEIVQECLAALFARPAGFVESRGALRSYLYGAVRNQALKRMRNRETPAAGQLEGVDGHTPEGAAMRSQLQEAVARAVAQLPFNQREVIVLAHYQQMAASEIAELIGIEVGAVKSRLQRARVVERDAGRLRSHCSKGDDAMTDQELDRALDAWEAPAAPARMKARVMERAGARRRWRVPGIPWKWAVAAPAALATVAVGAAIVASEPVIGTSWGQLADGTHIRVKTLVEPKLAILKWFRAGVGSSPGGFRQVRYMYDRGARTYWGYELTLEPLGGGKYSAHAVSLVAEPARLERWKLTGFTSVAPPALPAPRIIAAGEPFEVDLIRSGGERVYDRIELSPVEFDDVPHKRPLNDGPFGSSMMRVSNPRLFIDGRHIPQEGLAEARGMTIFFSIPGRGEWRLAVDAMGNPEYRPAGRVMGSMIEFEWNGERFRIENDESVNEGGKQTLYVRFEPATEGAVGEMATFGSAGPASIR